VRYYPIECAGCGHVWQSRSETGRTQCGECGERAYVPLHIRQAAMGDAPPPARSRQSATPSRPPYVPPPPARAPASRERPVAEPDGPNPVVQATKLVGQLAGILGRPLAVTPKGPGRVPLAIPRPRRTPATTSPVAPPSDPITGRVVPSALPSSGVTGSQGRGRPAFAVRASCGCLLGSDLQTYPPTAECPNGCGPIALLSMASSEQCPDEPLPLWLAS
jgi:hypothetical protein